MPVSDKGACTKHVTIVPWLFDIHLAHEIMLRVELDLYSGRENPSFDVDDDFADWLWERTGARESDAQPSHLGLRGAKLSPLTDDSQAFRNKSLYISADSQALNSNSEILSAIFEKIPKDQPEFDEDLISYLNARLAIPSIPDTQTVTSLSTSGAMPQRAEPFAGCIVEVTKFTPEFWNDPAVITKNNCYNYATNRRTNTFAQPGRATGSFPYPLACEQVRAAAISDGAKYSATQDGFAECPPDSEKPRWYMALAVWPGRDYHWYRESAYIMWCHKPGETAATDVDNIGRWIVDPAICDRGPYTDFCGYFISGKSSQVS